MTTEAGLQKAIAECKAEQKKIGYLAWHADADKRSERGEQEFLCAVCKLWRWKHELCKIAIIEEEDMNETDVQIKITLQLQGTTYEIYEELEHIQQFLVDAVTLSDLAEVLNTEKNAHDIQIRFIEKDKGKVE